MSAVLVKRGLCDDCWGELYRCMVHGEAYCPECDKACPFCLMENSSTCGG